MNTENFRTLSEDEKLSDFDKILLITGHINYQANVVREVLNARLHSAHAIENGALGEDRKPEGSFHKKLADDTAQLLKEVATNLYTEYEALVDFCNNCDAVSEIDIQLGEPVFNAMHDLVKDYPDTE